MIEKLKKLLTKTPQIGVNIQPHNYIEPLNKDKINKIILANRNILNEFGNWLSTQDWKNSYYGYGVPDYIFDLLDLDIGAEITYTDLIVYYASHLKNINYLELGVSVGKNFMQLANNLQDVTITGFDIENINPTILNKLTPVNTEAWKTQKNSLRTEPSYLHNYKYKSNNINYLAGDIWDEGAWKKLKGNKFNLIFSDALHDPKALLWEYRMIKKYNLLEKEFLFFWDDLNNGLERSFQEIAADMLSNNIITADNIYLIKINGWLGKNETSKHDVGIISTFNLNF